MGSFVKRPIKNKLICRPGEVICLLACDDLWTLAMPQYVVVADFLSRPSSEDIDSEGCVAHLRMRD
jgi:hypothetical protein